MMRRAAASVFLALLAALPFATVAADGGAPLVEGTDYVVIPGGEPFQAVDGQVEVVEVFGYTCGHCANFQPMLDAWKAKLPADVHVTYVPAPFGGFWIPYARAYYAAEALGVLDETHDAMFEALHARHALPIQNATPAEIGAWYAAHSDVDAWTFAATMQHAATDAKLARAVAFIQRAAVPGAPRVGTPMLVVNGKYRVLGNSRSDQLRIASALVRAERAAGDDVSGSH